MPNPTNFGLLEPSVMGDTRWFNFLFTNFLIGSQGNLTLTPGVDSTAAIQLTNAAGTPILTIDSTNSLIKTAGFQTGVSATAVALANAGTIATAGVGVARVAPAAAVTGIILQAGISSGQMVFIVNEAAVGNTIRFNTTPATANVANSANESIIPGLESRLFVWDAGPALWFPIGDPLINGTTITATSATSPDPGNSGTIATAGLGVTKVNPAGAETGVILAAGIIDGQEVTVVNTAAAANSITFAAAATSNVADGVSDVIAGLKSRTYVWESGTARWYPML